MHSTLLISGTLFRGLGTLHTKSYFSMEYLRARILGLYTILNRHFVWDAKAACLKNVSSSEYIPEFDVLDSVNIS